MKIVGIIALIGLGSASAFSSSSGLLASKIRATCITHQMNVDPCNEHNEIQNRRAALGKGLSFVIAVATVSSGNAQALDMDAFMNAELDSDVKNCE
mmetsp:Transcript_35598/g.72189  ORF Transcript_35598/g.72189 Transcript_35598/m.72189 type:complete len:96 (-) Transcript_35598:3272-3559(-)